MTKAKHYKAKPNAIKVATIQKGTSLKELAEKTESHYQTIITISARRVGTTKLRAKAIAEVLGVSVEDIFEEVKR